MTNIGTVYKLETNCYCT